MTLEEQLAALMAEHRLIYLTINAYAREDGSIWFGSNAHADNLAAMSDGSNDTARDAMTSAIERLNAKRAIPADVPALEAAA